MLADVGPETARVTTFGALQRGQSVNLERPLRFDGRVDGHFVLGHVDGVGTVEDVRPEGESHWLTIGFPPALAAYFIRKGSVAVDGISLTVAGLGERQFDVQVVPYTWAHTTLKMLRAGDKVNLECDMVGKYVVRAHGTAEIMIKTPKPQAPSPKTRSLRIAKGARPKSPFATIETAVAAYRRGEMLIVVDDEDRENEGDLTMAAEKVTPEAINFMVTHGRGLDLHADDRRAARRTEHPAGGAAADELDAASRPRSASRSKPSAARRPASRRRTGRARCWRPSIRRRSRTTWPGPATSSRCARAMAACWCAPARPRRRWIWRAWPGCSRPASSAKFSMNDGTMARVPELTKFARKHKLLMITIADLIRYRMRTKAW